MCLIRRTRARACTDLVVSEKVQKVAITRLGDRIRVAGTAELNGFNLDLPRARYDTILYSFEDLFPDGGDTTDLKLWTGLRPMNPDGTPTIGSTRYPNLFVNTGYGSLGWTMACGSAKVLADLVTGKKTDIDLNGLTLARMHSNAYPTRRPSSGRCSWNLNRSASALAGPS